MKADVSVIVPVYNGEKTIKKCVESLLGQTLEGIEVIVVNDGSTDDTGKVLDSISDERLRIITQKNSGQGIARNEGMKIACGKYIGFADADDTVLPDMYKNMLDAAQACNADMVQCAINDIKNNVTVKRASVNEPCVNINNVREYADDYFYTLKHTNEVCNKIFKREFLENAGLSFSDTHEFYSEDLKFNIEVLPYIKTVAFIDEAYYNYYISDSGHCKKNPRERAVKIAHLYDECIKNLKGKAIENCIKSMALITLLSYIAPFSDEEWAREIVHNCIKKGYMSASAKYKKTLKHTVLMICLAAAPYGLKKMLIKKYYVFEKEEEK